MPSTVTEIRPTPQIFQARIWVPKCTPASRKQRIYSMRGCMESSIAAMAQFNRGDQIKAEFFPERTNRKDGVIFRTAPASKETVAVRYLNDGKAYFRAPLTAGLPAASFGRITQQAEILSPGVIKINFHPKIRVIKNGTRPPRQATSTPPQARVITTDIDPNEVVDTVIVLRKALRAISPDAARLALRAINSDYDEE